MLFLSDVEISKEVFKKFVVWYRKNYNFSGIIRRSARSLGIAEIIDEDQNLIEYRFMNC